jgi:prefoldin subunit 5
MHDLQKQTNSSRNQIELLTNEIHQLEKTLNNLKEEKNQLIQIKMDGDQNDERQNLVRQITLEKVQTKEFLPRKLIFIFFFKDQYEQQTKELRIQIKQITNERQQIQEEMENISKQCSQISNEKVR